jgi:hypothetical protein
MKLHPGVLVLFGIGLCVVAAFVWSLVAGLITTAVATFWIARRLA